MTGQGGRQPPLPPVSFATEWRSWHVPCLPYPRYAIEINVTQSFRFLGNFFSNSIFEKLLSHEALVMGRVTATSNKQRSFLSSYKR